MLNILGINTLYVKCKVCPSVCVMVAAVQLSSLARAARHETQPETCRVSSQPAQPTNPFLVKPKK